jgi:hypothetical protein
MQNGGGSHAHFGVNLAGRGRNGQEGWRGNYLFWVMRWDDVTSLYWLPVGVVDDILGERGDAPIEGGGMPPIGVTVGETMGLVLGCWLE